MAKAEGIDVIESICAAAAPAGRTSQALYEEYRDAILDDLREAGPVDIVLLCLHGAMASEKQDDCEGDIIAEVREAVGPECTIGVELDLHCHLTAKMLEHSNLLVAYKEYPHIDIRDRAEELFHLAVKAARGEVKPVTRAFSCNLIGLWRTRHEPVRSLVDDMLTAERQGLALNISFGHGFQWADVADVGAKVWVTTDNDPAAASLIAEAFATRVVDLREAGRLPLITPALLIERLASAREGLIVAADVADNPGGGAPADSTFILRELIDNHISGAVVGALWDMTAVEICRNAGVGATLELRVGGKCGKTSGAPVDGVAIVRSIVDDHQPPGLGGKEAPLGTTVWVTIDGVDVVLSNQRNQTFHPAVFTDHGIDLTTRRLVVVKSIEHFGAAFAPIASEIFYITTPGALLMEFEKIPYTLRSDPYWPRVEDPKICAFPKEMADSIV
jgi:microcystin degradation protein MlrC